VSPAAAHPKSGWASQVPLFVLFVTAFVDMIGLTMVIPLLPYYATDFGASAMMVGVLISAFSIAQLLVAPTWGRFSDRYGRRPAILAGLLLTAVAYVLFSYAGSIVALLVSRLIQGTGGGTIGVVQAYVADASDPKERTKSLGWLSVVTSMGAVAGPAFGSAMISLGGRRAPGLAAATLSVLVALFAPLLAPFGEREVVGGQYLAVASVEMDYLFVGNFGAAVFVDAGNAADTFLPQPKVGAGIGFRWRSPVGMLRIDLAHPFDDPNNNYRLHISIGPDL